MALAATIYMSLLGKSGMREVADCANHKAHYAAQQIEALDGYKLVNQQLSSMNSWWNSQRTFPPSTSTCWSTA
jgi:glycine cleavage system pyridoxal-binding protein P